MVGAVELDLLFNGRMGSSKLKKTRGAPQAIELAEDGRRAALGHNEAMGGGARCSGGRRRRGEVGLGEVV